MCRVNLSRINRDLLDIFALVAADDPQNVEVIRVLFNLDGDWP